jgi:tagatose 1,6-diphosphate aldolase
MTYPLGRLRGLRACASDRGTFTVLALDHRQNLRHELRPGAPASVTYDEMVVEATGYTGVATDRVSRVLEGWGVPQAKRMGADAAKLLVYYHPDAPGARSQERLVADVAAACVDADLALFVEPLGFSIDPAVPKLVGDERRRVVIETARRMTALGGDVLKAEFPFDPGVTDEGRWADACAELDAASRVPWVLLSGGVDDATFERQVRVACRAGASGVLVGRSVWAPSALLAPAARDQWLASEGRTRLARLADLVAVEGRPWQGRATPLTNAPAPVDGWYRDYPG